MSVVHGGFGRLTNNQTNLAHLLSLIEVFRSKIGQLFRQNLSTNVAVPHQSGAPFVDEQVFQNCELVASVPFVSHPLPRPLFFALAPTFALPLFGKLHSNGNVCQAT